jgi:hypothetical protein
MITYAEIALLVLRIVYFIMGKIQSDQQFNAGVDAEIARAAQAILRKTQAGKAIMEKVDAMAEADVDAGLRELEPK